MSQTLSWNPSARKGLRVRVFANHSPGGVGKEAGGFSSDKSTSRGNLGGLKSRAYLIWRENIGSNEGRTCFERSRLFRGTGKWLAYRIGNPVVNWFFGVGSGKGKEKREKLHRGCICDLLGGGG